MEKPTQDNYELLIRIDEQLKSLMRESRENNIEVNKRFAVLEDSKVTKAEFGVIVTNIENIVKDQEGRLRDNISETRDLRTQLRTWGTALGVGLAVLQFILKYI